MKRYIHRRNIRFKNEIAKADKSKILGVAIDPSSNFHRIIIFNFLGEIIGEPFSIDTLKTGYVLLRKNINKVKKRRNYTDIYIAIESAGAYSENLYINLYNEFQNVVLIPALSVANNRKQKSLYGLKTDDIDCGAIGDLLIRGEFIKYPQDSLLFYKLRFLIYWRENKIKTIVMLKNQISDRLKRCYPGLNCDFNDNKKLYTETESLLYQGLINNCMTGQKILNSSEEALFMKFNYESEYSQRRQRVKRLKSRLNVMLLPEEDLAKIHLDILAIDVRLLRAMETELKLVEEQIVELGKKTPAIYLMGQIKGITDLHASMYVGLIGNLGKYKSAQNIYSLSGMSPKIQQSGAASMSRSTGIKRAGNILLRTLLFKMSQLVILNDPTYNSYYHKIKSEKNQAWKKNIIAVCRRLNNLFFALMRDKSEYRGKTLGIREM